MSGGFLSIRELCIALEHRWNPDALFLIFTAYFDESDTHGKKPNVIMAAFLGSARQWELFGRRYRAMQREYQFKTLHSKDFRARRGEFEGWHIDKCRQLATELADAICDNLTEGVSTLLPHNLYESVYLAPPIPAKMPIDSQYGLCFRISLYRLIQTLAAKKKRYRLHIVIEDGHKNVRNALRIFDEIKIEMLELGFDVLGSITIEKKSENDLLAVADFQAHLASISEAHLKAGKPGYFELAAITAPSIPLGKKSNEAMLSQFEFTAETLADLKVHWQRMKEARVEKWRAARDARRALAASSPKGQPS
jgi:hypothetical protein